MRTAARIVGILALALTAMLGDRAGAGSIAADGPQIEIPLGRIWH